MAVITVYGKTPDVGSAAFVAPNATLAGDVVLAAGSSVWYGAVVRGDTGAIRIGKNSNIQDTDPVSRRISQLQVTGDQVKTVIQWQQSVEKCCIFG